MEERIHVLESFTFTHMGSWRRPPGAFGGSVQVLNEEAAPAAASEAQEEKPSLTAGAAMPLRQSLKGTNPQVTMDRNPMR